tara:strand:- start:197 stop:5785 length:5589 start_codon:yes stop_codon:yes gene_type:complete
MAQKKQISKLQGFTHGMVSDSDPRFQIEGSYSDALNVRLTNQTGDTFTIENIDGNSILIDLFAVQNQDYDETRDDNSAGILGTRQDIQSATNSGVGLTFSEIYWDPSNTDSNGDEVGTRFPSPSNPPPGVSGILTNNASCQGVFPFWEAGLIGVAGNDLENKASIVGYTSFGREMILVIVASFTWRVTAPGSYANDPKNRTIFLRLTMDENSNVESIEDLAVCYSHEGDNYPDLNMDIDKPIRIESLVENECISRIYWTDNKNPLRTLNTKQTGKNQLPPTTLNITPLLNASQPVMTKTLNGNLPVGVYQYVYKYITANGGESTFSPLSNLYHASDQGFGQSSQYGGGPRGETGTQGFKITIPDVDTNYQHIELYTLLYEEIDVPPRLALVDRRRISPGGNNTISINHISFANEIENGLEEVLIESNTFDLCKDIAIKDNILFAANLRQRKNVISEKEWNVKVMRFNMKNAHNNSGEAQQGSGILTTADPEVKAYELNASGDVVEVAPGWNVGTGYYSDESEPKWATRYTARRKNGLTFSAEVKTSEEFRFLRDGITLGAESHDYTQNGLGGCRITFAVKEKTADISTNTGNPPFVDSYTSFDDFQTDNLYSYIKVQSGVLTSDDVQTDGTSTTYSTSMSIGGSKDPHLAGNTRGYQRGEIYRFGVQIFDLNGIPGNVLWIGDIQTPEMYDVLRMLNVDAESSGTNVYDPLIKSANLSSTILYPSNHRPIISHRNIKDHRLSYVYGHTVPPVDVAWYNGIIADSYSKDQAYIYSNGEVVGSGSHTDDLNGATAASNIRPKWYPGYVDGSETNHNDEHTDTHNLYDLYVNFEFLIPEEVCKKISGFRVVRAERKEEERRVQQQGILNQTLKYGRASQDLDAGYDTSIHFSVEDNVNLGDDPIFTNAHPDAASGNFTTAEQLEYNAYLNGYVGLAENNHIAHYNDSISNGKIAPVLTGKGYAFPETENKVDYYSTTLSGKRSELAMDRQTNGLHPGMGKRGTKHMHSSLFGSYEKCQHGQRQTTSAPKYNRHPAIMEYIFTLDSPDSAFGTRPYNFREGDMLRIDSVMKLTDERRYTNNGSNSTDYLHNGSSPNAATGSTRVWGSAPTYGTDQSERGSLKFASKKKVNLDKNYGYLIGKYYIYDTYWGIGMEVDGGVTYGHPYNTAWTTPHTANPNDYRQKAEILVARELGQGEIMPASFFKKDADMIDGDYTGFSNNTLGFVHFGTNGWYAKFGGLHDDITDHGSGQSSTEDDLTYNTMSTLQMGLRTIILEVDQLKIDRYNFHPRNLSNILQNQSFESRAHSTGALHNFEWGYWLGHNKNTEDYRSLIPYKYLCSIVRKTIPYGGSSKSSIEGTRYIPCGNFHPVKASGDNTVVKQFHNSKVFGGDTFVNLYSHQKTACPYMRNSYARWQLFPVESFVNTDMRSGLTLNAGDTIFGTDPQNPPFSNDWLYNEVYSQENNLKSAIMVNEQQTCDALDLPYEIAYSNTKILGETGDAFRVFPINQFHDMEGQFGEINRIINFKNDIYVVQDEAIAKLLVNPISMISDDTGQSLFTGTGDTVENHIYISTKFGTRHTASVTTSEEAIYFVDSRYARLFKYNTEKLISLGDSLGVRDTLKSVIKDFWKLDSFEKDGRNYLSDNTLKFLGIQSIFDHKNKELMVTFHNSDNKFNSNYIATTLVFNEGINAFTSYYSVVPSLWMSSDPGIISTGNEISVTQSLHGYSGDLREGMLKLWKWDSTNVKTVFFDEDEEGTPDGAYLEKAISDNPGVVKTFDNAQILMSPNVETSGMPYSVSFRTDIMTNQSITGGSPIFRYREGQLRFPLRTESSNVGRLRGGWAKIKFTANTTQKFNIFAILAKYRKSYN